jgi:hypothetical protein
MRPWRVRPALYLLCTLQRPVSYPAIGSSTVRFVKLQAEGHEHGFGTART